MDKKEFIFQVPITIDAKICVQANNIDEAIIKISNKQFSVDLSKYWNNLYNEIGIDPQEISFDIKSIIEKAKKL